MPWLQEGTSAVEALYAMDVADDGSVILGGDTDGAWVGTNAGGTDFVAVKLSANGIEEWRWQVSHRRLLLGRVPYSISTVSFLMFGCGRRHDILASDVRFPHRSQYALL